MLCRRFGDNAADLGALVFGRWSLVYGEGIQDQGLKTIDPKTRDQRRYAIMRCRSWPDDRRPSRLMARWREESPNSEGQCAG
jgi:hypothetical protein